MPLGPSFYLCFSQLDEHVGKLITVALTGVKDLAGNSIPWPITWGFTLAAFDPAGASVAINGLVLSTAYSGFSALDDVKTQLAAYFDVSAARIGGLTAYQTDAGKTGLAFKILPPAESESPPPESENPPVTATALAHKLIVSVSGIGASSDFSNYAALSDLVASDVCLIEASALVFFEHSSNHSTGPCDHCF
jgi:hypothetical protein